MRIASDGHLRGRQEAGEGGKAAPDRSRALTDVSPAAP